MQEVPILPKTEREKNQTGKNQDAVWKQTKRHWESYDCHWDIGQTAKFLEFHLQQMTFKCDFQIFYIHIELDNVRFEKKRGGDSPEMEKIYFYGKDRHLNGKG